MSKGGLTAEQVESVLWIIAKLEKQRESVSFLNPVDYQELNLPDYPTIIKHPMDLGTVSVKLEEGLYMTIADVTADLQLIWDNCKTYNDADSLIVAHARKLERMTQKWYAQCQQEASEEETLTEAPVTFEELVDLAEIIRRSSKEVWREAICEIEKENLKAKREYNAEQTLVSLSGISRNLYERLKSLTASGKSY
jgi:hypothetical protein